MLRHAAPEKRYHGRYIGHTDIGVDPVLFDATQISPLLALPYDQIYSSDLSRCTRTLEMMGFSEFRTDPLLREVHFRARFEGKSFAEIEHTEGYDPAFLASAETWHRFVCDETPEAFAGRVGRFLDSLPLSGRALVCTHAGVIREILSQLASTAEFTVPGYLEYTRVWVK